MDQKHEWSTEEIAELRATIRQGLVSGLGNPMPGAMCIEAAICFVKGLPHGDVPPCVANPDRAFAIKINDARWSSNVARAAALEPLAIAQLNTAGEVRDEWLEAVVIGTINRILPPALEAVGLTTQAIQCRAANTLQEACAAAAAAARYAAGNAAADAARYAAVAVAAAAAAAAARYAAGNAAADAAAARDRVLQEAVNVALDAYRLHPHADMIDSAS